MFFIWYCLVLCSRSCWFLLDNSIPQIFKNIPKSRQINEKVDKNASKTSEKNNHENVLKLQQTEKLSTEIFKNEKKNGKIVVFVFIFVFSNELLGFFLSFQKW